MKTLMVSVSHQDRQFFRHWMAPIGGLEWYKLLNVYLERFEDEHRN